MAAAKTANAEAGDGGFVGDPFRAPHRWAGKRGRYQKVTYTDRDGNTWPAARFGPPDASGGPHPGVLFATVGGNSTSRTIDATDSFTATPTSPTSHGEFNPWHEQLDRSRLAIVGHSGAAGVALDVGNRDPRFAAIVAWDPAASASLTGVTPRIPTMIQVADYTLSQGPVPCHADRTARFTSVPGWPANRTRSRPIACCCVAGEPTISTTSARCS